MFYIGILKPLIQQNGLFNDDQLKDTCEYGSCMTELMLQMLIVFGGLQFWHQFVDLVFPWALKM